MAVTMTRRERRAASWAVLGLAFGAFGCSEQRSGESLATDRAGFTVGPSLAPSFRFEGDEDGDLDEFDSGFGRAVALADANGDGYADLVVGAPEWGSNDRGAAFLIEGSASGLAPVWSWKKQGAAGERFGRSVANAGDVNADGFDDVAVAGYRSNGRGFVSVFHGSASGLSSTAAFTRTGTQDAEGTGAQFGFDIAGAGDVNGDGYDDFLIGARYESNDLIYPGPTPVPDNQGAVYIHAGGPTGLRNAPTWSIYGEQSGALGFGHSVDSAGDVNADGYDDIVVGSDNTGLRVFLGSAVGFNDFPFTSRDAQSDLGYDAAGVGDVNGDGYDDVGGVGYGERAAQVFLGPPATVPAIHWRIDLPSVGRRVTRAGDVNGDGFADLLVSSDSSSNGETNEGLVHLFTGSATGLTQQATALMEGNIAQVRLGMAIAGGADVTGDGFDDIVAGAFGGYPNPTADKPSFVAVYEGAATLVAPGSSGAGGSGGTAGTAGTGGGGSSGDGGTGGAAATGGSSGDGGTGGAAATGGSSGDGSGATGGVGGAGNAVGGTAGVEPGAGGESSDAGAAGESSAGEGGTNASGGSGNGGSGTGGNGAVGGSSGSNGSSSAGESNGAGDAGEDGAGAQGGSSRGGSGSGGRAGGASGATAGAPTVPGQAADDGGCGCRTAPRRSSDFGAAALAILAFGALKRRRTRAA
jgi:hypothetical protein